MGAKRQSPVGPPSASPAVPKTVGEAERSTGSVSPGAPRNNAFGRPRAEDRRMRMVGQRWAEANASARMAERRQQEKDNQRQEPERSIPVPSVTSNNGDPNAARPAWAAPVTQIVTR